MENTTKFKITKEDVFGRIDSSTYIRLDDGLTVAKANQICPIFGDLVPYKSQTIVCKADQESEVQYWLVYVLGDGCVSKRKILPDGRIALRADYRCW